MVINKSKMMFSLGVSLLAMGSLANAAPITGTVNISATVGVSATTIDFYSNPATNCGTSGPSVDGCFSINFPATGSFSTLTLGSKGTIKDLIAAPNISGAIFLAQFMNFQTPGPGGQPIFFDLYNVPAGSAPTCAPSGNAGPCTPVIATGTGPQVSPFTLQNSAGGVIVSFSTLVEAYSGVKATGFSNYVGAFSTQLAGQTVDSILADIAAGRTVEASYSANFVGGQVPEPGTLLTFGIGFAAILFGSRKLRA